MSEVAAIALDGRRLGKRSLAALEEVDRMPRALRACVHEYGLPIVTVLTKHGIKNPAHIREVVKEVWGGARQEGQRGTAWESLDWLIEQSGGVPSAKALFRLLADNNLAVVSMEPTRAMLDASMGEVSGFNVRCTREEKHRRRLRAAIRAGART